VPYRDPLKYIELDSIKKPTDFETYVFVLGFISEVPSDYFKNQKFVLYSFDSKQRKVKDTLNMVTALL